MFRSLLFDFRHDALCKDIGDQFMLGPSILVCPILEPVQYGPHSEPIENPCTFRKVYLPSGQDWFCFWTKQRYSGGQWLNCKIEQDKIPLFIKSGSILPMSPVVQHSSDVWKRDWQFEIYGDEDAEFDIYEDSGDGYDYEDGKFCWTSIKWSQAYEKLDVGIPKGDFRSVLPDMKLTHQSYK
jgi:alpha-D-xyloside xylohydrolase